MALIEQTVYVSVKDSGIEPKLYMVQADTGRTIRCVIQDWDIPSGASAKVYVRKISGKVVYNTCEVDTSTNSVLIDVTNQMIAEAGADNLAMVEITSGDECVTTFAFFLVVKYKFGSGEESKNESTWVDELMQKYIDEATALVKDAQDAAEEADNHAEVAKESASEAATSAAQAEDAMNTVTDAAERAEKAAASAATSEANAAASAKEAGESADAVLAESEKIDERLDRAEGLIDVTLQAADDASASAVSASASAEEAKSEAERAKDYAEEASKYSLAEISDKEVTFTSGDAEDPESWADVSVIESGETLASLVSKISTMVKNVRYLYKMLGTTDISGYADGTVTGCIEELYETSDETPFAVYNSNDKSLTFCYCRPEDYDIEGNEIYRAKNWPTGDYSSSEVPWYSHRQEIETVKSDNFENYHGLTTLRSFFYEFTNVTSFDALKGWDVSGVDSLYATFSSCYGLLSIDFVSDWDVSKVTTLSSTFNTCNKVTSLNALKEWDVSNVTTLQGIFGNCSSLTSLEALKDWNVSKVTTLYGTFSGCTKLAALDGLAKWNTENVTNIYSLFSNCNNAELIDLTNWDLGSVAYKSYALRGIATQSGECTIICTQDTYDILSDGTDASEYISWNVIM